jgi:hypothetical protein
MPVFAVAIGRAVADFASDASDSPMDWVVNV